MIIMKLQDSLDELGISRYKLSMESKSRVATLQFLVDNEAKSIKFQTLDNLLNAMNRLAIEQGIDRRFGITDIIDYEYVEGKES